MGGKSFHGKRFPSEYMHRVCLLKAMQLLVVKKCMWTQLRFMVLPMALQIKTWKWGKEEKKISCIITVEVLKTTYCVLSCAAPVWSVNSAMLTECFVSSTFNHVLSSSPQSHVMVCTSVFWGFLFLFLYFFKLAVFQSFLVAFKDQIIHASSQFPFSSLHLS